MNNKDPFAAFRGAEPKKKKFGTEPHKMVRKTDINTSKEAAKTVNSENIEKQIYDVVKSFGFNGCITEQVIEITGSTQNTINPRFAPLLRRGLIVDTGERRMAKTGRRQRVVVADVFVDQATIIPIEKKVKRCPHCQGEL
jgi:uncharacterized protein with PIN domain